MRKAAVDPAGTIVSVLNITDPRNLALNTPPGTELIDCPAECRPDTHKFRDGEFVASVGSDEWAEVRARRNALLEASDAMMFADSALPDDERGLWLAYREALRNITTAGDPAAVEWPTTPKQQ
jgi:hypothetical protein